VVAVGHEEAAAIGRYRVLHAGGDEVARRRRVGDRPCADVGHQANLPTPLEPVDPHRGISDVRTTQDVAAHHRDQGEGPPAEEGDVDGAADGQDPGWQPRRVDRQDAGMRIDAVDAARGPVGEVESTVRSDGAAPTLTAGDLG
jgi:hypothetical protein